MTSSSRISSGPSRPEWLYTLVRTAWGWCGLASRANGICRSCLPQRTAQEAVQMLNLPHAERSAEGPAVLATAAELLVRYFDGEGIQLSVPLDLRGLPAFTAAVLAECAGVARGMVISYGELAARAGKPKAARAVGQVMARNPLAPFVPCHRVVGADGSLTGFGSGLAVKAGLLELEGWEVASPAQDTARVIRSRGGGVTGPTM